MSKISLLASVITSLVVGANGLTALAQVNTADVPAAGKNGADNFCSGAKCERGAGHGGRRGKAWEAVQGTLTEQQREQIKAIKESARGQVTPQREKLKALREQIDSAKPGTNVDELKQQATQLREQMHSSMKEAHEKMQAVLTPEQQAKLAACRPAGRHKGEWQGKGCDKGGKGCEKPEATPSGAK